MALIETLPNGLIRPVTIDQPRPAPAAVIDLRDIFGIIRRQRGWVLWPVAICTIGALIVAFTLPPRYTATAQILLDVKGLRVLQSDLNARAEQPRDTQLADAESQLQVVSSGGVLTAVVEREKLQDDPEFGAAPPSLLSSLLSLFGVHGPEETPTDKAVRILAKRLVTKRPDKTFV